VGGCDRPRQLDADELDLALTLGDRPAAEAVGPQALEIADPVANLFQEMLDMELLLHASHGGSVHRKGEMRVSRACAFLLSATVVVLAGCGGGGRSGAVTVAKYGSYPAQTIAKEAGGPVNCRTDARALAHDAKRFVAHTTTTAAYPADLYYSIIREAFADFEARSCSPSYLRAPLTSLLTAAQRKWLVADLPATFAAIVRTALS